MQFEVFDVILGAGRSYNPNLFLNLAIINKTNISIDHQHPKYPLLLRIVQRKHLSLINMVDAKCLPSAIFLLVVDKLQQMVVIDHRHDIILNADHIGRRKVFQKLRPFYRITAIDIDILEKFGELVVYQMAGRLIGK